ncbi:MAG: tyrosine-protein phosphatase [Acidimicrobiales bacterium]
MERPPASLEPDEWAAGCSLEWPGTWNARDLGGIPTIAGRLAERTLIRSDSLQHVDRSGWDVVMSHGVRTLVDLRNRDQAVLEPQFPPDGIETRSVPLEQDLAGDPEFDSWARRQWLATPLYFERFVSRWPQRCAEAVEAIVDAEPGGVLVHCGRGTDRTGLIIALVLELVGADRRFIVEDYLLSTVRLRSGRARRLGRRDDDALIRSVYRDQKTTPSESLLGFLDLTAGGAVASALGGETVVELGRRLVAA